MVYRLILATGTTTAEKLEWTSGGVDYRSLPFPPSFIPRLTLLRHPSSFNHSISHLFSPTRFGESALSSPYCPVKRQPVVAKVGGDLIQLVPTISKVGGDAAYDLSKSLSVDDKSSLKGTWSGSRDTFYSFTLHEISLERLKQKISVSNFIHEMATWSVSLVKTNSSPSGRGWGHVTDFYILGVHSVT